MHERVARIPKLFLMGVVALILAVSLDVVEAHPWEYEGGPSCPVDWGDTWMDGTPIWCTKTYTTPEGDHCCHTFVVAPFPEPHTHNQGDSHPNLVETETSKGCDAFSQKEKAQSLAIAKLNNRSTSGYRNAGCITLGQPRMVPNPSKFLIPEPIRIFSERVTHDCPKELNWNADLSNIGREYTVAVRCVFIYDSE